jgi:flagellar hook-associated protein 1 FlgK
LANNPQDQGLRQVVLQDGTALAQSFTSLRTGLSGVQTSVNSEIKSLTSTVNQLASGIATLNGQIAASQGAGIDGGSNSLMDQRDADLQQLAGLVNIKTEPQSTGAINVYIGSQSLVLNTTSQTIAARPSSGSPLQTQLSFTASGSPVGATSGQIGSLLSVQSTIASTIDEVDTLASNTINAVNQVYASGQGLSGFTNVTATNAVSSTTVPLSGAAAGLTSPPINGSFVVHVTQPGSGLQSSTLVQVNLTGSSSDTTLDSLTAQLNGIDGVTATDQGGRLRLSAQNGAQISFSQDSSNILSSLGVNTFFTGSNAANIAVNQTVQTDPTLLAASQNGSSDDNQTALAIAGLSSQTLSATGGQSLVGSYQAMVDRLANATSAAQNNAEAADSINQTLTAQQQSISGVSIDEQTIDLLKQQRTYQASAQLISTVNQTLQYLLQMI